MNPVPDHCTRALAKAQRNSVDTSGALAVAHTRDGGADLYLLVYPDRLELASTGTLMRAGAGRERIPLAAVTSVTAHRGLLRSRIDIETGGHTVSFGTDRPTAPYLADLIQQRLAGTPAAPDNTALLHHLTELHAAGLLTDDEYATKRDNLLKPPS
ncbi:hypothetical protein GCM10010112_39570 [Actinoplanes lobatus]|uniref:SHOCT domain-containing protein n=1 Tax=Actinoplanes lobatus TaxID=113568 RepID=A0A7W7MHF2_9ACTN|nr:hypothetical protein [Actinoplanes lobatus]MBB4750409.1 hypothetical protein [Actinoplanes lobatus]GGN71888.1 hypothetical protein GCM10010112_39570 [Actinoplanes lobatus]GIE45273.1 hypothetical protein Alo02nite_81710 [Actinoplanes lobatus]